MKNFVIVIVTLLISSVGFSQHVLEWSLGEVDIICGEPITISYPLLVSISEDDDAPVLGSTTMRFIYGSEDLNNLSIQNIQNGYYKSGLHQSNPVLGNIFGFSSDEGIFVQFDIMDNANANPLMLSTTPTHVLDIMFDIDEQAQYPLCIPFVFDNNPDSWGLGIAEDDGYVPGSAGIVGSYYLFNDYSNAIVADDEVINLSWKKSPGNSGKIKIGKKLGKTNKKDCIKNNICNGREQDCDDDGIPDMEETDANANGIPDDCESGILEVSNGEINTPFTVYPVPFDQEVFVKYTFDYDTDIVLEVIDTKGVLVRKIVNRNYIKGSIYQQRIDLSLTDFQLLFVRLTTNKSIGVRKIVSNSSKRKNKK